MDWVCNYSLYSGTTQCCPVTLCVAQNKGILYFFFYYFATQIPKDSQDPFTSRFLVVDLPGAEKLSEDPTQLRMREGPTLNRSIVAFGNLVAKLAASPKSTRVINYG